MNVVIYARFSSHSQTEQSIEGQLKVCYEYAESNHYPHHQRQQEAVEH